MARVLCLFLSKIVSLKEKNILDIKCVTMFSTPSRDSFGFDKYLNTVEREAEVYERIHVKCSLQSAVPSICTACFNTNTLRILVT
jgi:hypothetical protein